MDSSVAGSGFVRELVKRLTGQLHGIVLGPHALCFASLRKRAKAAAQTDGQAHAQ